MSDTKICPIYSFEEELPTNLEVDENGRVQISDKHFRDGSHSLRWRFRKSSKLIFNGDVGYRKFKEGSKSQARDSFAIWIYNEKAIEDILEFKFGKRDKVDCSFKFGLNFTGWRTAWVMFDRDMEGKPSEDMDKLTIISPEVEGELYLDQIILSSPVDPRHHTRDFQVPFVNLAADKKANSHWLSLYYYSNLIEDNYEACNKEKAQKEFNLIEKRFEEYLLKDNKLKGADFNSIKEEYLSYDVVIDKDSIRGKSILHVQYDDVLPSDRRIELKEFTNIIDLKSFATLLLKIALAYRDKENEQYKKELALMFIDLVKHFKDQGWDEGSSMGTTHHLGYSMKNFYDAAFLMRDILEENSLLDYAQRTMSWYSGFGKSFHEENTAEKSNMDVLNTLAQGMFASVLLIKDIDKKSFYMKNYSSWISESLMPEEGLIGPFKVDGAAYHHCNHYPAYAQGGLTGITPIIYFISGTEYRITEESHKSIKKVVMSERLYCNKYEWLLSLSARHPSGKWKMEIEPFMYLSLSGNPEGTDSVDREVAKAYLRLASDKSSDTIEYLKSLGMEEEKHIEGNWSINYASLAIHRRKNWLIGARGHSKYLWANETYRKNNLYGRYITHGNVQIMSKGEPINNEDSGYVQLGWDWNRWPGTTTVHMPIENLRSDVRNLDTFSGFEEMLLSDEAYSGACNLENMNGMFAMKLHEHPKYEGSHRARKSIFFFDNRAIFLGSDIENENKEYNTETTLFQNHLVLDKENIYVNEEKIDRFPYSFENKLEEAAIVLDNKDNGYYIPKGQFLHIANTLQHSKDQNSGEDTEGNFSAAWINHGSAPKGASYEYAILIDSNMEELKAFREAMKDENEMPYKVIRKDTCAHIVSDRKTGVTGYALFEAMNHINVSVIEAVDVPVMVMTKEENNELKLSLCDPDLRLYEGIDEDQYDENGNRKEVSVYSRKWMRNPSKEGKVKLTLNGKWTLASENEKCKVISSEEKYTVLQLSCKDAEVIEVKLSAK